MSFEKWERHPALERLAVTVSESRLITFHPDVAKLFHLEPNQRVMLYFDAKRRLIGMRLIKQDRRELPRIRANRRSWSIHAPKFFRNYAIEVPGVKRFACRYDRREKMLVIDLTKRIRQGRPQL
jgi:hypothetical protein